MTQHAARGDTSCPTALSFANENMQTSMRSQLSLAFILIALQIASQGCAIDPQRVTSRSTAMSIRAVSPETLDSFFADFNLVTNGMNLNQVTALLGAPLPKSRYSSKDETYTSYAFGNCPDASTGNEGIAFIVVDLNNTVQYTLLDLDCVREELISRSQEKEGEHVSPGGRGEAPRP